MRIKKLTSLLVLVFACVRLVNSQTVLHPVIKNYGGLNDVPFAIDKPDPSLVYNIVVEVSEKIENPKEVYPPLEHIARMYNLHVYGGVPQKNLHVAAVIWGFGIPVIMNNEAYKKKFGVDNPNIGIIEEMKKAGIDFFGCGQSIRKFEIDPVTINPNVTPAISRFTTVSTLQLKGYAFFKY